MVLCARCGKKIEVEDEWVCDSRGRAWCGKLCLMATDDAEADVYDHEIDAIVQANRDLVEEVQEAKELLDAAMHRPTAVTIADDLEWGERVEAWMHNREWGKPFGERGDALDGESVPGLTTSGGAGAEPVLIDTTAHSQAPVPSTPGPGVERRFPDATWDEYPDQHPVVPDVSLDTRKLRKRDWDWRDKDIVMSLLDEVDRLRSRDSAVREREAMVKAASDALKHIGRSIKSDASGTRYGGRENGYSRYFYEEGPNASHSQHVTAEWLAEVAVDGILRSRDSQGAES